MWCKNVRFDWWFFGRLVNFNTPFFFLHFFFDRGGKWLSASGWSCGVALRRRRRKKLFVFLFSLFSCFSVFLPRPQAWFFCGCLATFVRLRDFFFRRRFLIAKESPNTWFIDFASWSTLRAVPWGARRELRTQVPILGCGMVTFSIPHTIEIILHTRKRCQLLHVRCIYFCMPLYSLSLSVVCC